MTIPEILESLRRVERALAPMVEAELDFNQRNCLGCAMTDVRTETGEAVRMTPNAAKAAERGE